MLNSLFQWRAPRASFRPDKLLYMGNVPNRWSGCTDELDEVCKWSILTSSVEIIVRNVNKITRNIRCLPHMDKPVGSWFAQMVNKIQDSGKFRPGNTFTICTNQFHDFPFIKDGFKEMEHKFLFGTTSKRRVPLTFPAGFSGQFLWMVNNHNDISCSANEKGTGKYVTR